MVDLIICRTVVYQQSFCFSASHFSPLPTFHVPVSSGLATYIRKSIVIIHHYINDRTVYVHMLIQSEYHIRAHRKYSKNMQNPLAWAERVYIRAQRKHIENAAKIDYEVVCTVVFIRNSDTNIFGRRWTRSMANNNKYCMIYFAVYCLRWNSTLQLQIF